MKTNQKKKLQKYEEINSNQTKAKSLTPHLINPNDLVQLLKGQLEQEWKLKNIPFSICEVYFSFISSLHPRKAVVFMQKELADLRSYNSLAQICLKGINAREESLLSIKEMCDYLSRSQDWENIKEIRIECAEILHAHRMLTLNVAESIERWKEFFLFENPEFFVEFLFSGTDYLEKVKYDLAFLASSELAKIFKFSKESDPFLIYPSKVIEKNKPKIGSSYFLHNEQVIIPLPSIILKRVQKMDALVKSNEKPLNRKVVSSASDDYKNKESAVKSIAETLYRQIITEQTLAIVKDQVNEFIAKMLILNLDPVIDPLINKIITEALSEVQLDRTSEYHSSRFENKTKLLNESPFLVSQEPDLAGLLMNNDRKVEPNQHPFLMSEDPGFQLENKNKTDSYSTIPKAPDQSSFHSSYDKPKEASHQSITPNTLDPSISSYSKENQKKSPSPAVSKNLDPVSLKSNDKQNDFFQDPPAKLKATDLSKSQSPDTKKTDPVLSTKKDQESTPIKENPKPSEPSHPQPVSKKPENLNLAPSNDSQSESHKRSSMNAKRLQIFSIIESLIRVMIETLIKEVNLESIVNDCISEEISEVSRKGNKETKRKLTIVQQNIQIEKLLDLVYSDLITSFIQLDWVEQIASSLIIISRNPDRRKTIEPLLVMRPELVLEEVEDFALEVFTPGVHSPNEVRTDDEKSDDGIEASQSSEVFTKVISEGRNNGKFELVSFGESLKNAFKSLEVYLKSLGRGNEIENIKKAALFSEDLCWFWLKDDLDITGCLLFSTITWQENKSALVHHFSTVNKARLKFLLDKSQKLLTDYSFKYILFNLNAEKELIKSLGFVSSITAKFSFPPDEKAKEFIALDLPEHYRGSAINQFSQFSLSLQASNTVQLSETPIDTTSSTSNEMKITGNRHLTLNSILALLKSAGSTELPNLPQIRLQRDLLEILEIIISTDDFEYPLLRSSVFSLSSESSLKIDIKFQNISSFTQLIGGSKFKFFRLLNTKLFKTDQYSLYEISTNYPNIKAFFIDYQNLAKELNTEVKGFKTDLFTKIENVLKGKPDDHSFSDIVLPAFSLNVQWDMPWVRGFELPSIGYVRSCEELVSLNMKFPEELPGLKHEDSAKITTDFVFGLKEEYLDRVLGLPLFVSLVGQNNWIQSN